MPLGPDWRSIRKGKWLASSWSFLLETSVANGYRSIASCRAAKSVFANSGGMYMENENLQPASVIGKCDRLAKISQILYQEIIMIRSDVQTVSLACGFMLLGAMAATV